MLSLLPQREDEAVMQVGTLLNNRYRIDALLGEGGMGIVYKAHDTILNRPVALKVLSSELTQDPDRVARFQQEARAASALNHPNILTIHELGHATFGNYIITEYVEGSTLRELLAAGKLEMNRLLEITTQAAEALAAVHRVGIVHRDIKPDNIMVRPDGFVKLLDFGLAKLTQPEHQAPALTPRTVPGVVLGTVQYMSPEQAAGGPVDQRTDVFSLGSVMYEMVTREPPFSGTNLLEVLHKVVSDHPRPPSDLNPHASPELTRIIEKCLAKDPRNRYQHTDDLAVDLRRLKRESETVVALLPKRAQERKRRRAITSLAVLPLVNVSDDADTDYLSDGITEYIINMLSPLPRLRVMARSTVFRFKGQEIDPRQVGRQLGVSAVLTGRVVHRGDALTIGAELVDVEDGWQLWGEQYTRKFSDIFVVQEELAREISTGLAHKLTPQERKRLAKRHTQKVEVYQSYLKALFQMNKRTAEAFRKAIELFEQALAIEPEYAPAYAGLAELYTLLGFGSLPPEETAPKATAAAKRAIELDDQLAEAHTSLGLARFVYYRDWPSAEREFKRAIALNPGHAPTRRWYGVSLTAVGRYNEAIAEITKAVELDPLSIPINSEACVVFFGARKYIQAIDQSRKTLELEPKALMAHHIMGLAYEQQHMFSEAIAALKRALEISPDNIGSLAAIAHVYAVGGEPYEARRILTELQTKATNQRVSPHFMALVHSGLGEIDEVIVWLEQSYKERSVRLVELKADPRFDDLRDDPRFQDLMRRAGLLTF